MSWTQREEEDRGKVYDLLTPLYGSYLQMSLFYTKVKENITTQMNERYLFNFDTDKLVPVTRKDWSLQPE